MTKELTPKQLAHAELGMIAPAPSDSNALVERLRAGPGPTEDWPLEALMHEAADALASAEKQIEELRRALENILDQCGQFTDDGVVISWIADTARAALNSTEQK